MKPETKLLKGMFGVGVEDRIVTQERTETRVKSTQNSTRRQTRLTLDLNSIADLLKHE
jgi:hypothetical protein